MKKNVLTILSVLSSLIGLVLCGLAIANRDEHSLVPLGLLFTNLGLWTNILMNRKKKKEENSHE